MNIRNTITSLLLLACFYSGVFGQSKKQDLSLVLQETVINKMFKAIGEIKGTNDYSFMLVKGTYTWTMVNPEIHLHANKGDFTTDVKVTISGFNYTIHVTGNVEICYEPSVNQIYVEIKKASFPLNIKVFGKEKHLWDVDLAKYFETPMAFEGPLTMGNEMTFEMPDKTVARIYFHPLSCEVKIQEKEVLVNAQIEFLRK